MFGPRVIIGTYLNVVCQLMLHTNYQGSRPGGFRQEDFFMFSLYISQCKKRMYDQEMPHSQTAYKLTAPRGRVKEQ